MKKLISILLSLSMLLSLCAGLNLTAYADTLTTGKCGENVTYSFNSSTKTLTLSGTGVMYDYSWGEYVREPSPFHNNSSIKTIFINSGITNIGNYMFYGCENITSVSISNSVTYIGTSSFMDCKGLKSVKIPQSVKEIGPYAFFFCSNLTSVSFEYGLETIGESAFSETNLTNITIPNSVTYICQMAFDSTKLTALTLSNNIKYIEPYAFDLYYLRSVNFSGTKKQWNSILIGKIYGEDESPYFSVHFESQYYECECVNTINVYCSDGTIVYRDTSSSSSSTATSKIALSKCKISGIANKTYTGKAITQNPKITYNGKKLKKNTDYTLSFKNNKKVGKATIVIKGKGKYKGTVKKTFKICKKLSPKATSIEQINTGTYYITVNYKGQKKDVTGYNIQVATNKNFSKKSIVVNATVNKKSTHWYRAKDLSQNVRYYVRVRTYGYNGAKNFYSGWSKVISAVTKLNKPTGLKVENDTNKPSPSTLKITWNKSKGAQGYEIYRSNKKKGKYTLVKKIGKGSKVSYTDTNLDTLKTYYYKVRAISKKDKNAHSGYTSAAGCKTRRPMKNVIVTVDKVEYNYNAPLTPNVVVNYVHKGKLSKDKDYTISYANNTKAGSNATVTLTGKGNYYGSKTVKFTISERTLPENDIEVSGSVEKNGHHYPSSVKIKSKNINLKEGTDFTFETPSEADASNWKITINFKGNYKGSVTKKYPKYNPRKTYSDLLSNKFFIAADEEGFPSCNGEGNCTWYAWGRAYEITGKKPDVSGDAGAWYNTYKNAVGKNTDINNPKQGSIIVWSGHVAIVEEVKSDGIVITESSYGGIWYRNKGVKESNNGYIYNYYGKSSVYYGSRFIPFSKINGNEDNAFIGYIYLI